MIKYFFIFCIAFKPYGQSVIYKQKIAKLFEINDSISDLNSNISNGVFDPLQTNYFDLENLLSSIFLSHDKKNNLKQSSKLTAMATVASKYLAQNKFLERKKRKKLQKFTDRKMRYINCRFGIVEFYSFTIDLVDDNKGIFFYDRRGEGDLKLFKGSKSKYEEIEDYQPLKLLSYEDISKSIIQKIKRDQILKGIEKKTYSYVGIHVEKMQKTFMRNKIPQARVVIYLGARRLQFLPES